MESYTGAGGDGHSLSLLHQEPDAQYYHAQPSDPEPQMDAIGQDLRHMEGTPRINVTGTQHLGNVVHYPSDASQTIFSPDKYTSMDLELASFSTHQNESDTLEARSCRHKRRRTMSSFSSDTATGGERVPAVTSIAGLSNMPKVTDSPSTASMSTSPTFARSPSTGAEKIYECPICNMGRGLPPRKTYTRKADAIANAPVSTETPALTQPVSQVTKSKSSWTTPNRLRQHVIAQHLDLFQLSRSQHFICILCPCDLFP